MSKQRSDRQRGWARMRCDGTDRQAEERRRDLRVDPFVVLDLTVAEIEEGLPANEAPGRPEASAEVVRIGAGEGVVEDQPEERLAFIAGEVGAVGRPDH